MSILEEEDFESPSDSIETTQDELDGFYVVKSILRQNIDVSRISMRDVRSYCGILLDDNNRKPICRLRFNRSKKYVSLFHGEDEERVPIEKSSTRRSSSNYATLMQQLQQNPRTVAHYLADE